MAITDLHPESEEHGAVGSAAAWPLPIPELLFCDAVLPHLGAQSLLALAATCKGMRGLIRSSDAWKTCARHVRVPNTSRGAQSLLLSKAPLISVKLMEQAGAAPMAQDAFLALFAHGPMSSSLRSLEALVPSEKCLAALAELKCLDDVRLLVRSGWADAMRALAEARGTSLRKAEFFMYAGGASPAEDLAEAFVDGLLKCRSLRGRTLRSLPQLESLELPSLRFGALQRLAAGARGSALAPRLRNLSFLTDVPRDGWDLVGSAFPALRSAQWSAPRSASPCPAYGDGWVLQRVPGLRKARIAGYEDLSLVQRRTRVRELSIDLSGESEVAVGSVIASRLGLFPLLFPEVEELKLRTTGAERGVLLEAIVHGVQSLPSLRRLEWPQAPTRGNLGTSLGDWAQQLPPSLHVEGDLSDASWMCAALPKLLSLEFRPSKFADFDLDFVRRCKSLRSLRVTRSEQLMKPMPTLPAMIAALPKDLERLEVPMCCIENLMALSQCVEDGTLPPRCTLKLTLDRVENSEMMLSSTFVPLFARVNHLRVQSDLSPVVWECKALTDLEIVVAPTEVNFVMLVTADALPTTLKRLSITPNEKLASWVHYVRQERPKIKVSWTM